MRESALTDGDGSSIELVDWELWIEVLGVWKGGGWVEETGRDENSTGDGHFKYSSRTFLRGFRLATQRKIRYPWD